MSDFNALLDKVKADEVFRDKILASSTIQQAIEVVNAQGFSITKADWLQHQASKTLELSDDELEKVAGGAAARNSLSACGAWESC